MKQKVFETFINDLEGFKIKIKEIHWNTESIHTHKLCDDILESISKNQDAFAEDGFTVFLKFFDNTFFPNKIETFDLEETVKLLGQKVRLFRRELENSPKKEYYIGLISICDAFIHELNTFQYLSEMN
jgi:DNA-binding ferritin-like protein